MLSLILNKIFTKTIQPFLLFSLCGLLFGCASSQVSRNAATNIDRTTSHAKNLMTPGDAQIADAYQNSSQATKGAIMGGAAGALTGALSSGVGVIPGTATGMVLGASYGKYIDANTTLQDQLENRGAIIVVLGDQVLIVLSSDRIFQEGSAIVKSQAYSTLNLTAKFINSFTKMLVKVAVYTGRGSSTRQDLVLSQQQAASVAKVLLASGVDARILYAIGYGRTRLVDRVSSDEAYNSNYRVEITLEKLYV